jgi:DNA-binding NtrC family response regulator
LLVEQRTPVVVLGPTVAEPGSIFEIAEEIRQRAGSTPIVLIASRSSEDFAIAALRAGINEYIKHPCRDDELIAAVERCLSRTAETSSVTPPEQHPELVNGEEMIGNGDSIREIKARLVRIASGNSTVLITGETGTGKELIAQVVHANSPRRKKPSITINCAAIPDSLLESELFGYEKGAFTGAQSRNEGKLKAAEGGTVFLDEIGDLSHIGQAKILRLLEGKELQRLGREGGVTVDVRFVAATNQNLEDLVKEGKFRKDLFFRLNVVHIHLPPLRERKEDLSSLIQYYISHFNRRFGTSIHCVADEVLDYLLTYDWPGNVRELKNLLESIFADHRPDSILLQHLPAQFRCRCAELKSASDDERVRLLWALSATNWNKSKAAGKLKWSRMTVYRKMAQYNISRL